MILKCTYIAAIFSQEDSLNRHHTIDIFFMLSSLDLSADPYVDILHLTIRTHHKLHLAIDYPLTCLLVFSTLLFLKDAVFQIKETYFQLLHQISLNINLRPGIKRVYSNQIADLVTSTCHSFGDIVWSDAIVVASRCNDFSTRQNRLLTATKRAV